MRNIRFKGMNFVVHSAKGYILNIRAYSSQDTVRNVYYWVESLPEAEEKVRLFTRFTVQNFGAVTVCAEVRRDDDFCVEATFESSRYREERWKLALHDINGNFVKWVGYPTAA